MTNLVLSNGTNTLGTYEYATDTISISQNLLTHTELLDFVMFHEMLHKQQKYSVKNKNMSHHTGEFKTKEKAYPNSEELEKQLEQLVTRKKRFWW